MGAERCCSGRWEFPWSGRAPGGARKAVATWWLANFARCQAEPTGRPLLDPPRLWRPTLLQEVPGQTNSFMEHIQLGVKEAAADPDALLLFSGGKTRRCEWVRLAHVLLNSSQAAHVQVCSEGTKRLSVVLCVASVPSSAKWVDHCAVLQGRRAACGGRGLLAGGGGSQVVRLARLALLQGGISKGWTHGEKGHAATLCP